MDRNNPEKRMRYLIVGGVAAGASAAAKLRRLDEHAEIIIFEKGPQVSFASCGLPYFVSGVIPKKSSLEIMNPEKFKQILNVDVRLHNEVVSILTDRKKIRVLNLKSEETTEESYDKLVLATGAESFRPPIKGIKSSAVITIRTIEDAVIIRERGKTIKSALVMGAGFIGLEVAENLAAIGVKVTVVEKSSQLLATFDPEMIAPMIRSMKNAEIDIRLDTEVTGLEELESGKIKVEFKAQDTLETDIVLCCVGARPRVGLAKNAGLLVGERGGIVVDNYLRTSDPDIYAAGDVIEVHHRIDSSIILSPLAGPATLQGRIAAKNIGKTETKEYCGVLGTAAIEAFGCTLAQTGLTERQLNRAENSDYRTIYLHPDNHVTYFPGSSTITMKVIFENNSRGRILGAQANGVNGVVRRIDTIAMAIKLGGSVFDLEEVDLVYTPQFGAPKAPVNVAGMLAANRIQECNLFVDPLDLSFSSEICILDVRNKNEHENERIAGSINIALGDLRNKYIYLNPARKIQLVCSQGKRAYAAHCILAQLGFNTVVLTGGLNTFRDFVTSGLIPKIRLEGHAWGPPPVT